MGRAWVLCAVMLFTGVGHVESQEQQQDVIVSGDVVSFPPVRQEVIDLVLDSIQSRSPLILPALKESEKVHPNVAGIWAGARTDIDTKLGEVVLRFRPTAEARLRRNKVGEKPLLESYEMTLAIRPRGMWLRHSSALAKGAQRGVEIALSNKGYGPSLVDFVPGIRDSGAYVAIPSLDPSLGHSMWSAYVCPRKHVLRPSKGVARGVSLELLRSPYELSEVKVDYKGEMQAQIPAEFREERLKIHTAYSKHLPRSSTNGDEVKSLSPTLYLQYKPQGPFSFFYFKPASSVQEGVLSMVEMENPVGYTRKQYFSDVMYIQRVDDPSPVPITVKGLVPYRDEGVCYLILMQKSVWSEYETPDDKRQKGVIKPQS